MMAPEVAVIGAGIAGLAAAHDLLKAGYRPTVFESRDRVGGRIMTVDKGRLPDGPGHRRVPGDLPGGHRVDP